MLRFRGLIGIGKGLQSIGIRMNSTKDVHKSKKFDVKMLEVLVCPLSKAPLRYDEEKNVLICDEIGVAYQIKNGIPNLIPTDAEKLTVENKSGDK